MIAGENGGQAINTEGNGRDVYTRWWKHHSMHVTDRYSIFAEGAL